VCFALKNGLLEKNIETCDFCTHSFPVKRMGESLVGLMATEFRKLGKSDVRESNRNLISQLQTSISC
jgi:hypothetical protein